MSEIEPTKTATRELPPIEGVVITDEPIFGSVQTLYPARREGSTESFFVAQATDGGSVFDVGAFFCVLGSGAARNTLRHYVQSDLADPRTWQNLKAEDFAGCLSDPKQIERLLTSPTLESLKREGMPTHHIGLIDRATGQIITGPTDIWSDLVLIRRFGVFTPVRAALQATLVYDYYNYSQAADAKIMALEHVVRLGNPGGSSLQDRYTKLVTAGDEAGARAFLAHYGVEPPLSPWSHLPNMVFEWTTKYEERDRPLSQQEALLISGVPAETMQQAIDLLTYSTVYAHKYFANLGLKLWDIKWEVAVDKGKIIVADTVDHDSIRITSAIEYEPGKFCHIHFNKQAIRDYLRIFHPEWHAALEDAKRRSAQDGTTQTFLEIYHQGVTDGIYPPIPQIDPEFLDLQKQKYEFVTAAGKTPLTAQELGEAELAYYRKRGQSVAFLERNAQV